MQTVIIPGLTLKRSARLLLHPIPRQAALGGFALALATLSATAQTYLFDFGIATTPTAHADAPNDPEFYWNNLTETIGTSATGQLTPLVTQDGLTNSLGLVMVRPFNGANETGSTSSSIFPLNATRDSLYGNTEAWNGITNVFPSFKFVGLDPAADCTFTFYASRASASDNREALYTVSGLTTETAILDAANNVDNTAATPSLKPTAAGEITVGISPSPNNNNAYHFTYLGVLKMEVLPPQTPISFAAQPVSQRVGVGQPVTFTAAVTGAQPYHVRWFRDGSEIAGARSLSYTIPSATLDLDGAAFAVSVSNLVYGVRSTNAVLRVVSDTNPPTILSLASPSGFNAQLVFSELVDPSTATDPGFYSVNGQPVAGVTLMPDGKTVFLWFLDQVTGTFTVTVNYVMDLAGNPVAFNTSKTATVPPLEPECFLLDFGGTNTTLNGYAPDDPVNFWNNVGAVGTYDTGVLANLITSRNRSTGVNLVMIRRFNGANEAGTTASPLFPSDATRDSLFGNTESFNSLVNIFPKFKLTGLDPASTYSLTFFASRTGATDIRETGYALLGANSNYVVLNASNNTTNTANATGLVPTAEGEITISLAPTARNNNANHFTYLGVLKMLQEPPRFLAPFISDAQIWLHWTGGGQLEWAPAVTGPWTEVAPAPTSPYPEPVALGARFYRIRR